MEIVQIGVGGWGKNHCRVLSELGALAAICDIDKEKTDFYATKYNVPAYYSLKDVMENMDFQGAVIATPTKTHSDLATILIKSGKHVFVEKPMTHTSKEGQDLVDLAKDHDVLLTSGYIERFNPAVQQVKDYVKQKTYGDLLMLEFHRESRMPLHIKDVGIIMDTTVHDIDTALWLFHDVPESVYARSGRIRHNHEDFASVMLGFSGNRVAIIASNWITPIRVRTFNAVFTEARISGDFISREVKIDTAEDTTIPRKRGKEPLYLELKNFIEAMAGKTKLVVLPNHALNVTKIAEAAIQSTQTGNVIDLNY